MSFLITHSMNGFCRRLVPRYVHRIPNNLYPLSSKLSRGSKQDISFLSQRLYPSSLHHLIQSLVPTLHFCSGLNFDDITFERISNETLESLTDYLEELMETDDTLQGTDILYSTGVLTLQLGNFGTYVINKQSPNKQIWFSSPCSGPKRYDYIDGVWIYKRDGVTLHDHLSKELSSVFKKDIDLSVLAYGRSEA